MLQNGCYSVSHERLIVSGVAIQPAQDDGAVTPGIDFSERDVQCQSS